MTSSHNANVQLLAALVDWDDDDKGDYRFLVDGKDVKYVTVDPKVVPKDIQAFGPALLAFLPTFPPGDWNEGHVSKDSSSGQPVFSRYERKTYPGVSKTWHAKRFDHLEFKKLERVRQNIHVVSHPLFDSPVLVKFSEFPWQIQYFEAETAAYELIEGHGIGPKFLGHLTEDGRVFGLVTEYIDGARTAGVGDLEVCKAALAKLHDLGIKHGDINKFNFLIRGEEAVLIDFETAKRCSDTGELEAEMQGLEASLADSSTRGGLGP